MQSAKSWIPLTSNDKILIVNCLVLWARKINNRYESEMYRKLAKKTVYAAGYVGLDGQEMAMMAYALNQEADCCSNQQFAGMYRLLAQDITQEKKKFHCEVYEELSALYLFPKE